MLEEEVKRIFEAGGHGIYNVRLNEEFYVDGQGQIRHEAGTRYSPADKIVIGTYLGSQTTKGFELRKRDPVSGQEFYVQVPNETIEHLERAREVLQPPKFKKTRKEQVASDPNALAL